MPVKIILLLVLASSGLYAQNIELSGGILRNSFYDREDQNTPHYASEYSPHDGVDILLGIDNVRFDWYSMRFTLGYLEYGGKFKIEEGGLGGSISKSGTVVKSALALGVYFLNLKFFNRVDFNLGTHYSFLLSQSDNVTSSGWQLIGPGEVETWENEEVELESKQMVWGFSARLAYDIYLNDYIAISPQVRGYLGAKREFEDIYVNSKQYSISLGIQVNLNGTGKGDSRVLSF
ncbi:MAG TPA: hypothetical protein VJ951_07485 [Bacteroidales bacterium]|nr:hypothetical protein [Bacteroidales bacterium]